MAAKISLDSFDRKILDCLQDNADMPLAEIARRVGLSTTPCWRRINRLQERASSAPAWRCSTARR